MASVNMQVRVVLDLPVLRVPTYGSVLFTEPYWVIGRPRLEWDRQGDS